MKILTIVTSQFGYDGISNVASNYYKYKDHLSIKEDWVVINPIPKELALDFEASSNKVYILPFRNTNPFKYIISLYRIIRLGKYDVVHVHGNSSTLFVEMLSSKMAGVKVRIAHSHNTKCDHEVVNKILKPFFLRSYTHAFACGKEAGEWLFDHRPFDVISNGIDLAVFKFNCHYREAFRKKYNLGDSFVIGHVGRFSKQKNHKKLIEIYSEFTKLNPSSVLVLVGDGELRTEIEEDVRKMGLKVLFVGLSEEVNKWLQVFDVFVMPSLFEGLPLVLIEAQAAGLPCVISDRISSSVDVTNLVKFVSLTASAAEWANLILESTVYDRASHSELIKRNLVDAHYDIKQNCLDIITKYKQLSLKEI